MYIYVHRRKYWTLSGDITSSLYFDVCFLDPHVMLNNLLLSGTLLKKKKSRIFGEVTCM